MAHVRRWIENNRARRELQPLLDSLGGKSVAIVGNATSLLSHRYGSLIDEHEIVVRMNRGFPVDPTTQGTRFDLWCFSGFRAALDPPPKLPPDSIWMWHGRMKKKKIGFDCLLYPRSYWQAVHDRLGARPSVGALTVDMVSRAAPRAVTVIGFDFKRTKSVHEWFNHTGPHDFAAEERCIMATVAAKSWRFVPL